MKNKYKVLKRKQIWMLYDFNIGGGQINNQENENKIKKGVTRVQDNVIEMEYRQIRSNIHTVAAPEEEKQSNET